MRSTFMICASALGFPLISHGHHSGAAVYDPTRTIEMEGEVTRVFWRNPHVHVLVNVVDSEGTSIEWDAETNSVSILGRMGITPELIEVGDRVRIAGWPARTASNSLFATNLLLADGKEVPLMPGTASRWTSETVGTPEVWIADGNTAGAAEGSEGIFRVWSTNMGNPGSFPLFNDVLTFEQNYPLTDSARQAREAWDPFDNPYLSCAPMGMPRVMGQPYPIEFVDAGDSILLRIELYDLDRRILLNPTTLAKDVSRSILGHSVGQWEGDALIVETTRVSWPYFDQSGVPLSESAVITERFTASVDGSRLDYELTVTDSQTFTEPVTLSKYWTWRPDQQVERFDCLELE